MNTQNERLKPVIVINLRTVSKIGDALQKLIIECRNLSWYCLDSVWPGKSIHSSNLEDLEPQKFLIILHILISLFFKAALLWGRLCESCAHFSVEELRLKDVCAGLRNGSWTKQSVSIPPLVYILLISSVLCRVHAASSWASLPLRLVLSLKI